MIVGIDLGTTNSVVAYYSESGPRIIPNRLGKNLTPSVVSVDENNQIYVGELAVERNLLYPGTSASVFKRDMGTNKKYNLGNKFFTPEELSSFVLRSLKEDAEYYLGESVTEAVISVPAYFNDARRRATKRAGELAGLKVERIISEPTAAALAYGLGLEEKQARYLVFDLGGGTFDVSILERYEKILEVRAVAGDNFLGGEDFTKIIENLFLEKNSEIDLHTLDEKTKRYINKQAEKCKCSFDNNGLSHMECKVNNKIYKLDINIDDYEDACEELFDRMKKPVRQSMSDANIRLSDIDKVVLIGGSTKGQFIKKFAGRLFRMIPASNINPDEAVALGAAIQAAMKERNESIREVILTDVCSFTLGTEVVREIARDKYETGVFCPIIERNTVIPTSRTKRLYPVNNEQKEILVRVLQGESRFAANNLYIGEVRIPIPSGRAREEAVDVTYTYDINSILEVEAKVVSTGMVKKEIFKGMNNELSNEEIEERFQELSYLKIHPKDREENKYLLLKGERMYEESLGEKREYIERALRRFEQALDTYDNGTIVQAKNDFLEFIKEIEE